MKKLFLIVISLLSLVTKQVAQIRLEDSDKGDFLIDNYLDFIDSTILLTNDAKVCYLSDSLFHATIVITKNNIKNVINLKYLDDNRGYSSIGEDFTNHILLIDRGTGIPRALVVIDKISGEIKYLGSYPFYIDKKNEICIYTSNKNSKAIFVIHNFKLNRKEEYLVPESCVEGDCYEFVSLNENTLVIKHEDLNGEMKVKRFKRQIPLTVD